MNTIEIDNNSIMCLDKTKCTGCSACFSACPVSAISMIENSWGFLEPQIDNNKCVNCGKCKKTCPALNPIERNKKPRVFAVWAKDDIRMKSSSGGAFSVIANYVLQQNGYVFGASFSDDYRSVKHICVNNAKGLAKIRGSKYLQSEMGDSYKKAKELLEKDNIVLFTGCPCQIAGLYRFLDKKYDNLITADIVCHGVPSPKVYKKLIDDQSQGRKLIKSDFRDKERYEWGTATELFFNNGAIYTDSCEKEPYFRAFLSGLSTRMSCGDCKYTNFERPADFTLGDFWGISTLDSSCDDGRGTSLLLVNSLRAMSLLEKIKNDFPLIKEMDLNETIELAKKRNGQLIAPTKPHRGKKQFFENLETKSFVESFNSSINVKPYDIGYVGWWDSKNYGSSLTCFAFYKTLTKMGYSVLMLEHPGITQSAVDTSYGMQFATHFYQCSKITTTKDFNRFNKVCDTFVVGSDQLWNYWCNKDLGFTYYMLDFVYRDNKKIAYAASFGGAASNYPEDKRLKVGYYLSRFDAVSVREFSSIEVCKKEFDTDVDWVLDPVFLCDLESYDEAISLSKVKTPNEYVYAYILDPNEDKIEAVRYIAKCRNLPYKIAIDGLGNDSKNKELLSDDPNIIQNLRIEDWLKYIKNASYVVTDSFHGYCFSMIFQKQAIGFVNRRRGSARFDTIVKITGLSDFIVDSFSDIKQRNLPDKTIDYEIVNSRIDAMRVTSFEWLKKALTMPKRPAGVKELELWKSLEHDKRIYLLELENQKLKKALVDIQGKLDKLENK